MCSISTLSFPSFSNTKSPSFLCTIRILLIHVFVRNTASLLLRPLEEFFQDALCPVAEFTPDHLPGPSNAHAKTHQDTSSGDNSNHFVDRRLPRSVTGPGVVHDLVVMGVDMESVLTGEYVGLQHSNPEWERVQWILAIAIILKDFLVLKGTVRVGCEEWLRAGSLPIQILTALGMEPIVLSDHVCTRYLYQNTN